MLNICAKFHTFVTICTMVDLTAFANNLQALLTVAYAIHKCFSKRVANQIPNLQAKFINTRMTSFWMYVFVSYLNCEYQVCICKCVWCSI